MTAHPDSRALARSAALRRCIEEEIHARGGWMGFDRYMDMALYTPELGYYENPEIDIGEGGDFVTAPTLGGAFARAMSRQILEILSDLEAATVVEFGAGTGRFAADFLNFAAARDRLPGRYHIVETSAALRLRQEQTIAREAGPAAGVVDWSTRLDGVDGVVFANEVLDAMPVKRFCIAENGAPLELGVAAGADGPAWQCGTGAPAGEFVSRLAAYDLPAGYESEIGAAAGNWVGEVAAGLGRGVILVCDYGFPGAEYYHPQRSGGTLMCHYRHRAGTDPFRHPGLRDITAHVDFSALNQAAGRAGLDTLGYCSQGSFLLSLGLLDDLERVHREQDTRQALESARQVKQLTMPHEMGELFKVIAFGKNHSSPLRGFSMHNHWGRL